MLVRHLPASGRTGRENLQENPRYVSPGAGGGGGKFAEPGLWPSTDCDARAWVQGSGPGAFRWAIDGRNATEGGTIDFYVGWSDDTAAGTGNPAMLTGTDAGYSGGAGGTLAGGLKLLKNPIGSLVLQATNDADAAPQVGLVATITPKKRYMILVVVNNSGATLGSGGTGLADELAVRVRGRHFQAQD